MKRNVTDQILRGAEKGGKHYEYDRAHDESKPADMWFQESDEGLILFIVFYSQACRWSRCTACNLPSKMSAEHVGYRALIQQIDHVFADPRVDAQRNSIHKVIISNNGSVLDEATFSSTALIYLMAKVNLLLPNVSALTMETRPEYVDLAELEFLARALDEGDTHTHLELAIGFEAFDDRIRNDVFMKGLSLDVFEDLVGKTAPYGFRLKCYFMQKPVAGMSDREAVEDIQKGIAYFGDISRNHGIDINMHLNPTYVARGTVLEESFLAGKYQPPRLADTAKAVLRAREEPITVFVGLYDEGLAVEGGSFLRPGDEPIVERLEAFNRTQEYSLLEDLIGS
jgi:radical SAM enzyme (TIGR01210 family)